MSAALTVRPFSGALYLMPGRILIVTVLPSADVFGMPDAMSGVGVVAVGAHEYSQRCVGSPTAM